MARICHCNVHQNALKYEENSRQIECGADDGSNPVDIGFRRESKYKKTRRDENASYNADFETNLGSHCASCFCITRCDMIFLVQTVPRVLR